MFLNDKLLLAADLSPHPRYRLLERIGKGGMGEVFRAHDRLTGQSVALKRVYFSLNGPTPPASVQDSRALAQTVAATEPQTQATSPTRLGQTTSVRSLSAQEQTLRLHLTQEFRTLSSLRHPHIVSVIDYGFADDRQPYFTMEFLEGAVSIDKAGRDQPLPVQVALLQQVLQAVTYLHRCGILHRDLKPGNILVTSGAQGLHIKVVDFGLALAARDIDLPNIAGTLGYIAPEILRGDAASPATDLFAVGVIAYELLVGVHPFAGRPTGELVQQALALRPNLEEDSRLDAAMKAVLRRAMAHEPGERYADAVAFSHDLCQAAQLPLPKETLEIRNSFLQAAAFVARGSEFAQLRQALTEAARGRGALFLIGGESGVGKSRLLDELRTLALVRGLRVVQGQAVNAAGGAYQVWKEALRPLCLDAALTDLDAGVLRAAVPDIAALLDRPVPEPPVLTPQSAHMRLLLCIESLLRAQSEPLLILLEDLHWAEATSLAVLQRLLHARALDEQSLLIVGTFRSDERPELPFELPGAQTLVLHRLKPEEIAALSAAMLGAAGRRPELLHLLTHETEGNLSITHFLSSVGCCNGGRRGVVCCLGDRDGAESAFYHRWDRVSYAGMLSQQFVT